MVKIPAMTFWLAPTANFTQTTLNGAITSGAVTITLNSTTGLQAPGYLVIDRTDSNGGSTPNNREVITYTGISGTQVTGVTRGADGSTARSHSDAAVVETVPTVGLWNSLSSVVQMGFDTQGLLKAVVSPVSIANLQDTQMAVSSVASIAQLNIGNLLSVSGASVIGFSPAFFQSMITTLVSIGSTSTFVDFHVTSLPATFPTQFGKITWNSTLNPGASSTNGWQIAVNGTIVSRKTIIWPSESGFWRPWTFMIGTTLSSGATIEIMANTNSSIANGDTSANARESVLIAEVLK